MIYLLHIYKKDQFYRKCNHLLQHHFDHHIILHHFLYHLHILFHISVHLNNNQLNIQNILLSNNLNTFYHTNIYIHSIHHMEYYSNLHIIHYLTQSHLHI